MKTQQNQKKSVKITWFLTPKYDVQKIVDANEKLVKGLRDGNECS